MAEKQQIHPMTLYRWKRALQRGAETFLSGNRPKIDPQLRRLQLENQQLKEVLAIQTQELMLLKKKDELGLAHRGKGASCSPQQRLRILQAVQVLKEQGLRISTALKQIGIGRSSYYNWLSPQKTVPRPASVQRLTESERTAIIAYKRQQPHFEPPQDQWLSAG